MIYRILLLALLLSLGLGCHKVQPNSDVFVINGRIDHEVLVKLKERASDVKTVFVTSFGGRTEVALQVARIIRENQIKVVVRKYCMSACSQWILPAATLVEFEGFPLIAMHHSATAMRTKLLEIGEEEEAAKYERLSKLERAFYRDIGIQGELLTYPLELMTPVCFFPSPKNSERGAIFGTQANAVVISRSTISRFFGREVDWKWPETEDEIRTHGAANLPEGKTYKFITEEQGIKARDNNLGPEFKSCSIYSQQDQE